MDLQFARTLSNCPAHGHYTPGAPTRVLMTNYATAWIRRCARNGFEQGQFSLGWQ